MIFRNHDRGIDSDAMAEPKKRDLPAGRYDIREIAVRIEKRRVARNVEVKEICAAIGMEKWDWSRKVRLDRSEFYLGEIGRIADFLDGPLGWPMIPEEVGALLEKLVAKAPTKKK